MKNSELILNTDGSIYHLALLPEDIADTIILVGDPDRVPKVSEHFDRIDIIKQQREFVTHTGWIGRKRITIISTGIGTDNIDIVLNELDALVNIDFDARMVKSSTTSLNIIRIGTSGSIHPEVFCDDILVSRYAIGTDLLGQYYGGGQIKNDLLPSWSYLTKAYDFGLSNFHSEYKGTTKNPAKSYVLPVAERTNKDKQMVVEALGERGISDQKEVFRGSHKEGTTLTCPGFYAPQGRELRLPGNLVLPFEDLHKININGFPMTNMEMETAGIYLLAEKLGHRAISFNAILAERLSGKFSASPNAVIQNLISSTLEFASGIV